MNKVYGPTLPISEQVHAEKHRGPNESFYEAMTRLAGNLNDGEEHRGKLKDIFLNQRFLPAGRVQAAVGSPRKTTAFNCFVSQTIEDSTEGIMDGATNAFKTMRKGGGIGYDFSTLRYRGAPIQTLGSKASGAVSFMDIYDAVCNTVSSAGNRRGAQMGVLRIDHPDIEEFIRAKQNDGRLKNFNISVAVTDEFMEALQNDEAFDLTFEGKVVDTIDPQALWDEIMRSNWEWAEPGVLFIDTINEQNNLNYCEAIAATNPCLHPDTVIETIHGRVKIKDIKEPTSVYAMQRDGTLGISEATASFVSKKDAETLKITTRNGKSIQVTPEHLIHSQENGWQMAKQLVVGERITQLCRARRGVAYSGVKLSHEDNRSYKMEHRMVADGVYGIVKEDDVHHIDGDTYNNSIDNLEVLTHSEHSKHTATFDNPQTHQVRCALGKFEATGRTSKTVVPMPDELRSNNKNDWGNSIQSIEEGEVTDVYDLTVNGDHNFIANFMVVHNCGEQPLPPYGACLLGSFNLVKYIDEASTETDPSHGGKIPPYRGFNYEQFKQDIPHIVRAMDNVIDRTIYPLPRHKEEAVAKRRIGIGITGFANASEVLGMPYGSEKSLVFLDKIMTTLKNTAYMYSTELAIEKGCFPAFDVSEYTNTPFIKSLDGDVYNSIGNHGIRNSHLISIAPAGTISLTADNVSSGIEPVFALTTQRAIKAEDGDIIVSVPDYAYANYSVRGRTSAEVTIEEHLSVLTTAQRHVDSAVSKTCNVGDDVTWDEFKEVYVDAWKGGAKGITTFRASGKRFGILNAVEEEVIEEGSACFIDPSTGDKSCG